MRTVTILGSTGSIGTQTLEVLSRQNDFKIKGLVCGSNVDLFSQQIQKFRPETAVVMKEEALPLLQDRLSAAGYTGTTLLAGKQAVLDLAAEPVDWSMAAIAGTDGIYPTLKAAQSAKRLALANKEALVIAGDHLNRAAQKSGCQILPVDSEHSAIFQVFDKERQHRVKRIILTASGGPFLNKPLDEFEAITPEQAVAHPNWSMGQKVSVDSACLINKLLEMIEAYYLFGLTPRHYDVWVHPQSIVHSFVEYTDGVLLAQMGIPSMLPPIAYAYSWPDRLELPDMACDLPQWPQLSFFAPDEKRFPVFALRHAILEGGAAAQIAFAVSAEEAVFAFLNKRLSFVRIIRVIEDALSVAVKEASQEDLSQNIEAVMHYMEQIRTLSRKIVQKYEQ